MAKRRTYNTKPPAVHPKPFQSALWNHLEEIRQMRRARKMWAEIAAHLKEAHGLEVSYRTIRNFFIRTRSPKRRIPAGFEESLGAQPVPHPGPGPGISLAGDPHETGSGPGRSRVHSTGAGNVPGTFH